MMVKNLVRQHIAAVAGYNDKAVQAGCGEVIFSNVASRTASAIGREMDAIAALRPRVLKPGVHTVIALHPADGQRVSNRMWVEMVLEYRQRMGLEEGQVVVWRHTDKPHPHIHCLFNRVTVNDKVIGMWNMKRKLDAFASDMRRQYGLRGLLEQEFHDIHPELSQPKTRGVGFGM